MAEKVLDYDRTIVRQDTYYNCGPASTQIVLNSRGIHRSESDLGRRMGTDTGGTDYIGLVANVLAQEVPQAGYVAVQMPNDPPTQGQKDALWDRLVRSIDAGYGLVMNIVAPPSNYPRAVPPSTQSLGYGGGTVYHYVALMGYSDQGQRKVWWADPGFPPNGCWVSLEQTASLCPPKGYAWPAAAAGRDTPGVPPTPSEDGMTAGVLAEAMGCSRDRAEQMLDGMVGAMRAAQITTPLRAAHWCAQIGHESAGLQYMSEIWGPTAAQRGYEGRADLGNVRPGDGYRYRGSGPIQLTGRHNFGLFSEWCFARRYTTSASYLVDNPDLVRTDPRFGFLAASWYWTVARPNLNRMADADDLTGVTRAINGGTNGIADRRSRLDRCKRLGAKLLPPSTTGGLTMSASEELTKRFPSRSIYRHSDGPVDTLAGFVLNIDARIHEQFIREQAEAGDPACIDLVRREAKKGDAASRACLNRIEGASK